MLKGERENIGYLFCQKSERCAVRGLTSGIWNLASDIRYQLVAPSTALLNSSTSPVGTSEGRVVMLCSVCLTRVCAVW